MPASASTSTRITVSERARGPGDAHDCGEAALAGLGGDVVERPAGLGDQGGHLEQGQLGRQERGRDEDRVLGRGGALGAMAQHHGAERAAAGPGAAQERAGGAVAAGKRGRIAAGRVTTAARPWVASAAGASESGAPAASARVVSRGR